MNLVVAVTNILCKRVTEEEAKEFALKNYGLLACYIRARQIDKLIKK
jgi:hypothetical protein